MKNVTLSIDEELLDAGRKYAQTHHTTLNALIRMLLARTVQNPDTNWIDALFTKIDTLPISKNRHTPWTREDLYDV